MKTPKIPSDFRILQKIYERYYEDFTRFSEDTTVRSTKILVPINIEDLARDLNVDPDIIFGRFYYFLNRKHGYENEDGSRVSLFELSAGDDRHVVNFPLMAALYAEMLEETRKHNAAIWIAAGSLFISAIALVVSAVRF